MFLKYIDFIFTPFRAIQSKYLTAKNFKGNVRAEVQRVKSMKARGKMAMGDARQQMGAFNNKLNHMGQPAQQGAQMQQAGQPPGMPGMPPGMPGMPGMPQGPNPNPPISRPSPPGRHQPIPRPRNRRRAGAAAALPVRTEPI